MGRAQGRVLTRNKAWVPRVTPSIRHSHQGRAAWGAGIVDRGRDGGVDCGIRLDELRGGEGMRDPGREGYLECGIPEMRGPGGGDTGRDTGRDKSGGHRRGGHSLGTQEGDTVWGHNLGTQAWDTIWGHSLGTQSGDTSGGQSFGTQFGDTPGPRRPELSDRQGAPAPKRPRGGD